MIENFGINRGKGKPKGRSWASIMEEYSTNSVNSEGDTAKVEIVKKIIAAAKKSERWAIEILLDRIDGKVVQGVDMTTGGESLNASINFVGAPTAELPAVEAEVIECQAEEPTKILIT